MEKEDNQSDSNSQKAKDDEQLKNLPNSSNDENNIKKKSKKRERSPNSQNEQSHPLTLRNSCNSNGDSKTITSSTLVPNVQPVKKEKQKPESWNKIEQQIFFNALRQNGKNFESITQCFNARQKKYKIDDGVSVQRSKEQIRHFYYRTWHKIIKYISLPNLNQENQANCETNGNDTNFANGKIPINVTDCSLRDMQVKCLIAYNALMNKSYRWNKKTSIKLVELINHGWTTVREKGKITRLRMPICKLSGKPSTNDTETTTQNTNNNNNSIPEILSIHIEPNNETAYCRVHKLSQNPFVNIDINSNQTVKYLIEFLENKWKNRRNQFIEKFQIETQMKNLNSKSSNQEPQSSMTDSDDNDFQNRPNKKNQINNFKNKSNYTENLILYPNECHQLIPIDVTNSSSDVSQKSLIQDEQKPSLTDSSPKQVVNGTHILIDDPMGLDDCAVDPDNFLTTKKPNTEKADTKNFELNPDQIKTGLTCKNSFLLINGKDKKELTFSQLYMALNKPSILKFKYDWIIDTNVYESVSTNNVVHLSTAQSSSSSSSSFQTLANKQNIQQRFYIDTLASVANSFLKEIFKNKQDQNNLKINEKNESNKQISSSNVFKSPPNPAELPSAASIAVIQPNNTLKQTITVPIENVLQSLNEQQASKTKKLLSDLPKRRSRQRKPIMIVNSSHSQRPMLPKLNFNTQIVPLNNETDSPNQQNIVFSGPMAAIARQIVNNTSGQNDQNKTNQKIFQDELQSSQSPKIIPPSLQQTYSNLIPRILNNLIDSSEQNSGSDDLISESNNDDKNIEEIGSPQNLTNMSLLELSMNNADSLFGTSVVRVNNGVNDDVNKNDMERITESESSSKSNDTIQINLNDMSNISSILNSIVSQQQGQNVTSNEINTSSNVNNLPSSTNQGTSFNLIHRKSDIMVEWTDSMNDVSLSGCFLTDFQSPEKQIKKQIVNEASRDSIFFNMDSIMDILPSGASRYDDSSLLNTSMNTIDNIVGKSFSK